jgi:hypothetical protein
MWIDGYLSGVSGDTTLSWKNLEKFSTDLVAYCAKQTRGQGAGRRRGRRSVRLNLMTSHNLLSSKAHSAR